MSQINAKITPVLWFDDEAEDAANLYVSVFPNSKIGRVVRSGPAGPLPEGQVVAVTFSIGDVGFAALNGGPHFAFTEAVSFAVSCATQAEVDAYWEKLSADGGTPGKSGWVKDRFGVFWQIVPAVLPELINDPDPVKARRVAEAMLNMGKFDIAELRRAHAG